MQKAAEHKEKAKHHMEMATGRSANPGRGEPKSAAPKKLGMADKGSRKEYGSMDKKPLADKPKKKSVEKKW